MNISIGDYADINYDKDNNNDQIQQIQQVYGNAIYRYHIIRIVGNKNIEIAQLDDHNQKFLLINIKGVLGDTWQISGYILPHSVAFTKNIIDTQYFERDFTVTPIKITNILEHKSFDEGMKFTELNNGIILYEARSHLTINKTEIKLLDPKEPEETSTFLEVPLYKRHYELDIMNYNDDIYFYVNNLGSLVKFNLNTQNTVKYDKNIPLRKVYPLRNKKILCILENNVSLWGDMYIADLTNNTKIIIDSTILGPKFPYPHPIIHQLSNEDILLEIIHNNPPPIGNINSSTQLNSSTQVNSSQINLTEIYFIKVQNRTISKIFNINHKLNIIAVLHDDSILIFDADLYKIQIWDTLNAKVINLMKFKPRQDYGYAIGELLANGDVLFQLREKFYLFQSEERKIINLHFPLSYGKNIKLFKQLKNGNLLTVDNTYLSIMEFPVDLKRIDRRNYDKIKNNIGLLNPDMLEVIRGYL